METFKQLALMTTNTSPTHFLNLIKEKNLQEMTDYFIFNNEKNSQQFYQALDFLADDGIWTKEELTDYTFIAQTIDNDYIVATDDQTLVIPYSCYQSDSETFDLSVFTFFSLVEDNELHSQIIAKID